MVNVMSFAFLAIALTSICSGLGYQDQASFYGHQGYTSDYVNLRETTLDTFNRYICLFLNPCEEGYIFDRFGGKCYFFEAGDKKTWDDALETCEDMGASLARIESRADLNFVRELAPGSTGGLGLTNFEVAWIGLSRTSEGSLRWADGTTVNEKVVQILTQPPTNPEGSECYFVFPNDQGILHSEILGLTTGAFVCDTPHSFVCQKDPIIAKSLNDFEHFPMPTIPSVDDIDSYVPYDIYHHLTYNTLQSYSSHYPRTQPQPAAPETINYNVQTVPTNHNTYPFPLFTKFLWPSTGNFKRFRRSLEPVPVPISPLSYNNGAVMQSYSSHPSYTPSSYSTSSHYSPPSYTSPTPYYQKPSHSTQSNPHTSVRNNVLKIMVEEIAYKLLPCPTGYFYDENIRKCYRTSGFEKKTCIDAERSCEDLDGQLASFQTRYEMMIFNKFCAYTRHVDSSGRRRITAKNFRPRPKKQADAVELLNCWTGGRSFGGEEWGFVDGSLWGAMDQNINPNGPYSTNPATSDICVAVSPLDIIGASIRSGDYAPGEPFEDMEDFAANSIQFPYLCQALPKPQPLYPNDSPTQAVIRQIVKKRLAEETMPCEEGYFFFYLTGMCYIKGPDERSWYSARDYCTSIGASLASFQSRYEEQFINRLGASSRPPVQGIPEDQLVDEKSVWVGGGSIGGKPWQWVNNSVEWNVPGFDGIEEKNRCLVVYSDGFFGAGVGELGPNYNFPLTPYDCQTSLLPFVCMKDPGIPQRSCSSNGYTTSPIQTLHSYDLPSGYSPYHRVLIHPDVL